MCIRDSTYTDDVEKKENSLMSLMKDRYKTMSKGQKLLAQYTPVSYTHLDVYKRQVFTPKYRRKIIYNQYRNSIGKILRQLCSYRGVEILEGCLLYTSLLQIVYQLYYLQ